MTTSDALDRAPMDVWRVGLIAHTGRGPRLTSVRRLTGPAARSMAFIGGGDHDSDLIHARAWQAVCDLGCGTPASTGCVCGVHGVEDLAALEPFVPLVELVPRGAATAHRVAVLRGAWGLPPSPPSVALYRVRLSGRINPGVDISDPSGTWRGSHAEVVGPIYATEAQSPLSAFYGAEVRTPPGNALSRIIRSPMEAS